MWSGERDGDYIIFCSELKENYGLGRSVFFRWREIFLSFHRDETFVSELVCSNTLCRCEVLVGFVMKGKRRDAASQSGKLSIVEYLVPKRADINES